jgi:transposase-like protein
MPVKADPKREAKWTDHIRTWESSGQTRKAFCSEHGLNPSTLDYWRTRLNKKNSSVEKPAFVALPVTSEETSETLELRLPHGVSLIWQVKDFSELARQLRALGLL